MLYGYLRRAVRVCLCACISNGHWIGDCCETGFYQFNSNMSTPSLCRGQKQELIISAGRHSLSFLPNRVIWSVSWVTEQKVSCFFLLAASFSLIKPTRPSHSFILSWLSLSISVVFFFLVVLSSLSRIPLDYYVERERKWTTLRPSPALHNNSIALSVT